jgi:fibrillarin-like rRNA methylase
VVVLEVLPELYKVMVNQVVLVVAVLIKVHQEELVIHLLHLLLKEMMVVMVKAALNTQVVLVVEQAEQVFLHLIQLQQVGVEMVVLK